MAENNGSGAGYINERMDRAEAMLNQVAADHVVFLQDHQMLLRAQVVMQDALLNLGKSHEKLASSQLATDEKLNIFLTTVDDWIRRQSK